MDVGKAFGFVFEDEEWIKKVLIGALLMLLAPLMVTLLPAIGYGMEVARRVAKGHPQPLPEWDDWGTKFIEGFMSLVIGFVWFLPITIIGGCIWATTFAGAIAGMDEDVFGIVFIAVSICGGLIVLLYSLALALILPAALTHYAVTKEFGAAFRFGEVIGMVRNNVGAYLMVLLTTILAQIVSSLGSIALGCGVFFTSFYSILIVYHAFGQAYRTAAGNVESGTEFAY